MSLPFALVKSVVQLLGSRKRRKFIKACQNPFETQMRLKAKILANSRIPFPDRPTTYHDYQEGLSSLTQEPVKFYETTSGSTGTKKRIPYTKSLLSAFENLFILWAHDLIFHSQLNLKSGKFFMSVSPQIGEELKDDRQYLSKSTQLLLNPFLASNPNDHQAQNSHEFFLKISRDLIACKELEIISIWSPSYFLSVIDFMKKHHKELGLPLNFELNQIWPDLKLISCWNSAQAKISAERLASYFPNVKIQPKGLLMTEAPVTIPWSEANGALPLLTETFLEFMDEQGQIHLLHELKQNHTYTILTSAPNGFLRYNTNDLVRVTGFYYKTPVLEFIGRQGGYSDLTGEKLSELILRDLFSKNKDSMLFIPNAAAEVPHYVLLLDKNGTYQPNPEEELLKNHHYQLSRKLNQLAPLEIRQVENLDQFILNFYQQEGMVLGDIKERILINQPEQAQKFLAMIALTAPSSDPAQDK